MADGEEVAGGPDSRAEARAAGIQGRRGLSLSDVDRRRTQLWTTSLAVIIAITVAVALFVIGSDIFSGSPGDRSPTSWIVAVLTVGLALAFLVYILEKERSLRRLSNLLVEERVQSETLRSRIERERETIARLEELDRMKSDFVATVSHELRTPLTGIIGAAKTLSTRGRDLSPEQHREFMEVIEHQANKLLRLVEDFLTASRLESGGPRLRRERVDLRGVAESIINDLQHITVGQDRVISLVTEPERPIVWGDSTSVQQILSNLVENALKYAGTDAHVAVAVRETESEAIIEVADDGQGISKEQLQTIFERFRQAGGKDSPPGGGFGLGLFIVKNLVQAHRGVVNVVSAEGEGTVFTVQLPKRASDR